MQPHNQVKFPDSIHGSTDPHCSLRCIGYPLRTNAQLLLSYSDLSRRFTSTLSGSMLPSAMSRSGPRPGRLITITRRDQCANYRGSKKIAAVGHQVMWESQAKLVTSDKFWPGSAAAGGVPDICLKLAA